MIYLLDMKRIWLAATFCALALPGIAGSQTSDDSPVHWSAKPPAGPLRAGAQFDVKMEAAIDGNWHMYSTTTPPGGPIPTRFTVLSGEPFSISGTVRQSPPKTEFDPNFGIQTEVYAGRAEFWIPLKVALSAKPGDYKLRLQAYYQVCDDKSCLPPRDVPVSIKIQIVPGIASPSEAATGSTGPVASQQAPPTFASQPAAAPASRAISGGAPSGTAAEVQTARSRGFLPFLWLAMTMGALSLATPCVFPLIPITVSYFTKSAETNRAS